MTAKITVTLPSGKVQTFEVIGDRVYAGTSYWSKEQFDAALVKMVSAGAIVS